VKRPHPANRHSSCVCDRDTCGEHDSALKYRRPEIVEKRRDIQILKGGVNLIHDMRRGLV